MTDTFEISASKTIRKLDVGEYVEVLEGPQGDEGLGVVRVRAKTLGDSTIGWISVKGNQGTPFLESADKPFFYCTKVAPLEREFRGSNGDAPLRKLNCEEVLELLEGPRMDKFADGLRVRCRTCSDAAVGWFTLKDKECGTHAQASGNHYTCTQAIAMTDLQDINTCKVLRKLELGEVVRVLEGPVESKEMGVTRIRARSTKDQVDGWVTIRGNGGTVYAEASSNVYTMTRDSALQGEFDSESSSVRTLAVGEAVVGLEPPRDVKFEPDMRMKVRALSDDRVGWVSAQQATKPWSPNYKCVSGTVMHEALASEGAQAVRRVEVGEVLEMLDGPTMDPGLGVVRVRARADKDGAVGWVTIRGNQGAVYLVSQPR